jgi:hypothetical protein
MPAFSIRYDDPDGEQHGGTPTFGWRTAPEGLATKRQLRAKGLRPGGQPAAAQLGWRSGGEDKFASLYRIDQAKPVRPMTPAKWAAITAALRARRICPDCRREQAYEIPRRFGACNDCLGGYTAAA